MPAICAMRENQARTGIPETGLGRFCPGTPDKKPLVSVLENGDFFSWQGNRGVARRRTPVRRTSKAED
ncbi:MAG: hypothetical protein A2X80_03830 [Geobacteraceae bacterium GWB2_52_12]|nr:MAG: hypothetical protein A2X80_03830 [Geobacteraceae bacterium GWB2_52_12]